MRARRAGGWKRPVRLLRYKCCVASVFVRGAAWVPLLTRDACGQTTAGGGLMAHRPEGCTSSKREPGMT